MKNNLLATSTQPINTKNPDPTITLAFAISQWVKDTYTFSNKLDQDVNHEELLGSYHQLYTSMKCLLTKLKKLSEVNQQKTQHFVEEIFQQDTANTNLPLPSFNFYDHVKQFPQLANQKVFPIYKKVIESIQKENKQLIQSTIDNLSELNKPLPDNKKNWLILLINSNPHTRSNLFNNNEWTTLINQFKADQDKHTSRIKYISKNANILIKHRENRIAFEKKLNDSNQSNLITIVQKGKISDENEAAIVEQALTSTHYQLELKNLKAAFKTALKNDEELFKNTGYSYYQEQRINTINQQINSEEPLKLILLEYKKEAWFKGVDNIETDLKQFLNTINANPPFSEQIIKQYIDLHQKIHQLKTMILPGAIKGTQQELNRQLSKMEQTLLANPYFTTRYKTQLEKLIQDRNKSITSAILNINNENKAETLSQLDIVVPKEYEECNRLLSKNLKKAIDQFEEAEVFNKKQINYIKKNVDQLIKINLQKENFSQTINALEKQLAQIDSLVKAEKITTNDAHIIIQCGQNLPKIDELNKQFATKILPILKSNEKETKTIYQNEILSIEKQINSIEQSASIDKFSELYKQHLHNALEEEQQIQKNLTDAINSNDLTHLKTIKPISHDLWNDDIKGIALFFPNNAGIQDHVNQLNHYHEINQQMINLVASEKITVFLNTYVQLKQVIDQFKLPETFKNEENYQKIWEKFNQHYKEFESYPNLMGIQFSEEFTTRFIEAPKKTLNETKNSIISSCKKWLNDLSAIGDKHNKYLDLILPQLNSENIQQKTQEILKKYNVNTNISKKEEEQVKSLLKVLLPNQKIKELDRYEKILTENITKQNQITTLIEQEEGLTILEEFNKRPWNNLKNNFTLIIEKIEQFDTYKIKYTELAARHNNLTKFPPSKLMEQQAKRLINAYNYLYRADPYRKIYNTEINKYKEIIDKLATEIKKNNHQLDQFINPGVNPLETNSTREELLEKLLDEEWLFHQIAITNELKQFNSNRLNKSIMDLEKDVDTYQALKETILKKEWQRISTIASDLLPVEIKQLTPEFKDSLQQFNQSISNFEEYLKKINVPSTIVKEYTDQIEELRNKLTLSIEDGLAIVLADIEKKNKRLSAQEPLLANPIQFVAENTNHFKLNDDIDKDTLDTVLGLVPFINRKLFINAEKTNKDKLEQAQKIVKESNTLGEKITAVLEQTSQSELENSINHTKTICNLNALTEKTLGKLLIDVPQNIPLLLNKQWIEAGEKYINLLQNTFVAVIKRAIKLIKNFKNTYNPTNSIEELEECCRLITLVNSSIKKMKSAISETNTQNIDRLKTDELIDILNNKLKTAINTFLSNVLRDNDRLYSITKWHKINQLSLNIDDFLSQKINSEFNVDTLSEELKKYARKDLLEEIKQYQSFYKTFKKIMLTEAEETAQKNEALNELKKKINPINSIFELTTFVNTQQIPKPVSITGMYEMQLQKEVHNQRTNVWLEAIIEQAKNIIDPIISQDSDLSLNDLIIKTNKAMIEFKTLKEALQVYLKQANVTISENNQQNKNSIDERLDKKINNALSKISSDIKRKNRQLENLIYDVNLSLDSIKKPLEDNVVKLDLDSKLIQQLEDIPPYSIKEIIELQTRHIELRKILQEKHKLCLLKDQNEAFHSDILKYKKEQINTLDLNADNKILAEYKNKLLQEKPYTLPHELDNEWETIKKKRQEIVNDLSTFINTKKDQIMSIESLIKDIKIMISALKIQKNTIESVNSLAELRLITPLSFSNVKIAEIKNAISMSKELFNNQLPIHKAFLEYAQDAGNVNDFINQKKTTLLTLERERTQKEIETTQVPTKVQGSTQVRVPTKVQGSTSVRVPTKVQSPPQINVSAPINVPTDAPAPEEILRPMEIPTLKELPRLDSKTQKARERFYEGMRPLYCKIATLEKLEKKQALNEAYTQLKKTLCVIHNQLIQKGMRFFNKSSPSKKESEIFIDDCKKLINDDEHLTVINGNRGGFVPIANVALNALFFFKRNKNPTKTHTQKLRIDLESNLNSILCDLNSPEVSMNLRVNP